MLSLSSDNHTEYCQWLINRACENKTVAQQELIRLFHSNLESSLIACVTGIEATASGKVVPSIQTFVGVVQIALHLIPWAGETLALVAEIKAEDQIILQNSTLNELLGTHHTRIRIQERFCAEATYYHHTALLNPDSKGTIEYYSEEIQNHMTAFVKQLVPNLPNNRHKLISEILLKFARALGLAAIDEKFYPPNQPDKLMALMIKQIIVVSEAPLIDDTSQPDDNLPLYGTRLIEDYIELPPVPKSAFHEDDAPPHLPDPASDKKQVGAFTTLSQMEKWETTYRALRLALLLEQNEHKIKELAEHWGYNTKNEMDYQFRLFEEGGIRCLVLANQKQVYVVFQGNSYVANSLEYAQHYTTHIEGMGDIHAGFARAYHSIKQQLEDILSYQRKFNSSIPQIFIGHGIGGAVASLAVADAMLSMKKFPHTPEAFTFGQPLFATSLDSDCQQFLNDHLHRFAGPDDHVVRSSTMQEIGHLYVLDKSSWGFDWSGIKTLGSITKLRPYVHSILVYERRLLSHAHQEYQRIDKRSITRQQEKKYRFLDDTPAYLGKKFATYKPFKINCVEPAAPYLQTLADYITDIKSASIEKKQRGLLGVRQLFHRNTSIPNDCLHKINAFICQKEFLHYSNEIQIAALNIYLRGLLCHYLSDVKQNNPVKDRNAIRNIISALINASKTDSELKYITEDLEFCLDFHSHYFSYDSFEYAQIFSLINLSKNEELEIQHELLHIILKKLKLTQFFRPTGKNADAEAFVFALLVNAEANNSNTLTAVQTYLYTQKNNQNPIRWHRAALSVLMRKAHHEEDVWPTIIGECLGSAPDPEPDARDTNIHLQKETMLVGLSHWLEGNAKLPEETSNDALNLVGILETLKTEKPQDVLMQRLYQAYSKATANKDSTNVVLRQVLHTAGQDMELTPAIRLKAWQHYQALLSQSEASLTIEDYMCIGQCALTIDDESRSLQAYKDAHELAKKSLKELKKTDLNFGQEEQSLKGCIDASRTEIYYLLQAKARRMQTSWSKSRIYVEALEYLPEDALVTNLTRLELFQCVLSPGLLSIENGLSEIAEPSLLDLEAIKAAIAQGEMFIQDFFGHFWSIKPEYANSLFDENGIRADNKRIHPDHHDVHNVAHVGPLQIKENPGAVGLAFAAWAFSAAFFLDDDNAQAPGFVPALPAKIIHQHNGEAKISYVQLTPHVEGENLKTFLERNTNETIHDSIDMKSYSAIVILSFFLDLEDGRPQNIVLHDGQLTSIDNDHILIRDPFKDGKLELKNILFCLDLMDEKVHKEVRSLLKKPMRLPLVRIRLWLRLLEIYTLQVQKTHSAEEIKNLFNSSKDEEKVILQPFFDEQSMGKLHSKYFKMSAALNESTTLYEAHVQMNSKVAERYQNVRKKHQSPLPRFKEIMPQTQTTSIAIITGKIAPPKKTTMFGTSRSEYGDYDEFIENTSNPVNLLKFLPSFQKNDNIREFILNELSQDHFDNFQSMPQAQSAVIASIQPAIWTKRSREFHAKLIQMISHEIADIEYHGNPHLTDDDLFILVNRATGLTSLTIRSCKNMTGIAPHSLSNPRGQDWISLAFSKGLKKLILDDISLAPQVAQYVSECYRKHPDISLIINPNCVTLWEQNIIRNMSVSHPETSLPIAPMSLLNAPDLKTIYQDKSGVVNVLRALPQGMYASSGQDKTIMLWKQEPNDSRSCIETLDGHTEQITTLYASPEGKLLSASLDNTIKIWEQNNTGKWACTSTLTGHNDQINTLLILDDDTIVSAGSQNELRFWNLNKGVWSFIYANEKHTDAITGLLVLPDGLLVSASLDKTLKIWEQGNIFWHCIHTINTRQSGITALQQLPNGLLVTGAKDGTLTLWQRESKHNFVSINSVKAHKDRIVAITILTRNSFVTASWDSSLRFWQSNTADKNVNCFNITTEFPHTKISDVVLLPNGTLISCDWNANVRHYNCFSQEPVPDGVELSTDARLFHNARFLLKRGAFSRKYIEKLISKRMHKLDLSNSCLKDSLLIHILQNNPKIDLRYVNTDGCLMLSERMRLKLKHIKQNKGNHLIIDLAVESITISGIIAFLEHSKNITQLTLMNLPNLDDDLLSKFHDLGIENLTFSAKQIEDSLLIDILKGKQNIPLKKISIDESMLKDELIFLVDNNILRLKENHLIVDHIYKTASICALFHFLKNNLNVNEVTLISSLWIDRDFLLKLHQYGINKITFAASEKIYCDTVFECGPHCEESTINNIHVYESIKSSDLLPLSYHYPAVDIVPEMPRFAFNANSSFLSAKKKVSYTASATLQGGFLALGANNGEITILKNIDPKKPKCLDSVQGHQGRINSLIFLPNGRLISAGADGNLTLWYTHNNILQPKKILKHFNEGITSISAYQNSTIIVGLQNGTIELLQPNHSLILNMTQKLIGHTDHISQVLSLPDGSIVSASHDNTIKIWKLNKHRAWCCVQTLNGHGNAISSLCILPDGTLISSSWDKTIRFWRRFNEKWYSADAITEHNGAISKMHILLCNTFISHSIDGELKIWHKDEQHYKCIHTYSHVHDFVVLQDGAFILFDTSGEMRLFNFFSADTVPHFINDESRHLHNGLQLLKRGTLNPIHIPRLFPSTLSVLDVSNTPITDTLLEAILNQCPDLVQINAENCPWITKRGHAMIAARMPTHHVPTQPNIHLVTFGYSARTGDEVYSPRDFVRNNILESSIKNNVL